MQRLSNGALGVLLLLVVLMAPAAASTDIVAQSGPTMEASIGVGGFVAPGRPTAVSATISTPVLVSGRLRAEASGVTVSRAIEVPAGGTQVYELDLPYLDTGTRVRLTLVDDGDAVLATETVAVRSSFDELAVGVIGDESLLGVLGRVRTIVTDRPVVPLAVRPDVSSGTLDVLDYLVVPNSEGLDLATDWTRRGGRAVVEAAVASSMDLSAAPRPTGVAGVSAVGLGSGELVIVEDMASRSADEWAAILRPTPLNLGANPEWGFVETGGGLLQAATESGSRQVPSLPWLLFAIIGFAILVGPVNFLVLTRIGKRDWAWVTIPVVSLLAVVGFWVAGRQRIAGTNMTHASVLVADGAVRARSAVVVAAGVSGERTLVFGGDTSVFPERSNFGTRGPELRLESDNVASVTLDQLGFVGVGVQDVDSDVALPAVTVSDDNVTVSNDSSLSFWGWGVVGPGTTTVSDGDLLPGGSDSLILRPDNRFGFNFVDAVMNQRRLWEDPQRANSLWPFSQVLNQTLQEGGTYFVGFTDDYEPTVEVDGTVPEMPGSTLVMVRIDSDNDADPNVGVRRVGAEVIGTGFINWLDWTSQRVVATDELTVGFSLPVTDVHPVFEDSLQFGVAPVSYAGWDWSKNEFAPIESGMAVPAEMISPDGQVYVRLTGQEFGENPFSPDSLSLEWGA